MRKTFARSAALATAALAWAGPGAMPAQAAPADAAALCTTRDLQFQFEFKFRNSFPQAEAAQALYRDGVALCAGGDPETGAAQLAEALRKIHVEPDGR